MECLRRKLYEGCFGRSLTLLLVKETFVKKVRVAQLLSLLAILSFMIGLQSAHASIFYPYTFCPPMSCLEAADRCAGGASFTWLGLCQDHYYYAFEVFSVSCEGFMTTECYNPW